MSSLINQGARLYLPTRVNVKSKEDDTHKQIEECVVGEKIKTTTAQADVLFKENERWFIVDPNMSNRHPGTQMQVT